MGYVRLDDVTAALLEIWTEVCSRVQSLAERDGSTDHQCSSVFGIDLPRLSGECSKLRDLSGEKWLFQEERLVGCK